SGVLSLFMLITQRQTRPPLSPYTTLFRSAVGSSRTRVSSARRGDTRNTSCPTAMAAHCHSASQKAAAASRAGMDFLDGFKPSPRSEEHTSELQSRFDLVCRLLLEKKKTIV